MSRNGSGIYSLAAGNPVVTGTTVSSTWANGTLTDIASALTTSIASDGQTVISANIPMNSKKLTGLAAPTVAGDALSLGNVVPESSGGTGTTTGYYGFKNRIINGAMGIWQRGTSFATLASGSYVSDRWSIIWAGAAPASITQVTAPAGFKYATQITGAASNTYTALLQKIESVNCTDLASQSITISANLQASIGMTVQWQLQYANASDNWGATTSITSGTWSVTTSAQQFSATISSLPAGVANGLMLVIYPNNGGAFTSGTLTTTGIQLEKGSTATSFDYRPYGTELSLCQRYYQLNTSAVGYSNSTTTVDVILSGSVQMRVSPSVSLFNGTSGVLDYNVSFRNISVTTIGTTQTNNGVEVSLTVAATTISKSQGVAPNCVALTAEL